MYAVPVLLGVTFAVFLIISLIPGDPATAILGSYATPENIENLNRQLGLDKPFFQRYLIWVVNISVDIEQLYQSKQALHSIVLGEGVMKSA